MYQDDILNGNSPYHKGISIVLRKLNFLASRLTTARLDINTCINQVLDVVTEINTKIRELAG